jgi:predicted lactoylglutathione lyase
MKQDQAHQDQMKHDMGQDQTKKDDMGKDEMKSKPEEQARRASPRLLRQGALRVADARRGSAGLSQSNEKRKAMIDHIYLPVSDLKRSSEFYKKVLEPLGIDMPHKLDQPPLRGFAINSIPGFWLKNGEVAKDLYVAFTAKSADAVRASYKAAIDAGATSNKEPSLRPEWRADYFAANIGDPDGYNIEIAYKPWLYK